MLSNLSQYSNALVSILKQLSNLSLVIGVPEKASAPIVTALVTIAHFNWSQSLKARSSILCSEPLNFISLKLLLANASAPISLTFLPN